MDALEEYYGANDVYRTIIICGDDQDARATAEYLGVQNHTVACITTEEIEDERPLFMTQLRDFKDTARILVLSYPAWYTIKTEVEVYALPEHNLLVCKNIDDDVCGYIHRCIDDAEMRGFKYGYGESSRIQI